MTVCSAGEHSFKFDTKTPLKCINCEARASGETNKCTSSNCECNYH
jgi:hypothetical protein